MRMLMVDYAESLFRKATYARLVALLGANEMNFAYVRKCTFPGSDYWLAFVVSNHF